MDPFQPNQGPEKNASAPQNLPGASLNEPPGAGMNTSPDPGQQQSPARKKDDIDLTSSMMSNEDLNKTLKDSLAGDLGKTDDGDSGKGTMVKLIFLLIALALLAAIIGGGVYAYQRFMKDSPVVETAKEVIEDVMLDPDEDPDNDGLTNRQEAELGTNYQMRDTDGDGLSDGEEVNIYKTDPLNPDTDGDGFSDGEEVQAGYNPLGPGRL
jgi:hypothetical protein